MNNLISGKTLLFTLITIIVLGWSIWYWNNYPETYPPAREIAQRCGEEEKGKPYCVGFAHGYDWAIAQMVMDEALKNTTN